MKKNRTGAEINAQQAFEKLFTPPSNPFPEHELSLLEKAENIFMTHNNQTMALYGK
jgi:hypothetical protein